MNVLKIRGKEFDLLEFIDALGSLVIDCTLVVKEEGKLTLQQKVEVVRFEKKYNFKEGELIEKFFD